MDALLDREAAPAATPAPAIATQQQRQQQAAERQKQNQERAQRYTACQQQAINDHPEGGGELAKAVRSSMNETRCVVSRSDISKLAADSDSVVITSPTLVCVGTRRAACCFCFICPS